MEPTIYLFFKGDCLEAMTHYAEVLGGEIGGVFRNADAPDSESRMPGWPAPVWWPGSDLMHCGLSGHG